MTKLLHIKYSVTTLLSPAAHLTMGLTTFVLGPMAFPQPPAWAGQG
jgi:hypothetical protein